MKDRDPVRGTPVESLHIPECDAAELKLEVTAEMFYNKLEELVDRTDSIDLLCIPGVTEILSEYFNNEILVELEEDAGLDEDDDPWAWDGEWDDDEEENDDDEEICDDDDEDEDDWGADGVEEEGADDED